jgi:putative serine protease PepD
MSDQRPDPEQPTTPNPVQGGAGRYDQPHPFSSAAGGQGADEGEHRWAEPGAPTDQPAYAGAAVGGAPSTGDRPGAGAPPAGTYQPPIWASSAPMPSQIAGTPSAGPQRQSIGHRTRTLIATALLCGLIGGGVGAGATLAARPDQTAAAGTTTTAVTAAAPVGTADVERVAAKVLPSVVSIEASGPQESGTGSGIILDNDGHILTNNHVVVPATGGGSLKVTLNDGRSATATIVGRDPISDLAVIKISLNNLNPISWGDSSSLKVGQEVVAIGSPLGLSGTVTSGIVSALNRPVVTAIADEQQQQQQDPFGQNAPFTQQQQQASQTTAVDAIQTDAAINPGNSGGALVDMSGRLIGINSAIATLGGSQSSSQSGSIGLGFSIPAKVAAPIVDQLIKSGKATHAKLGASVSDSSSPDGAKVSSIDSGSAAAKAGLKTGDVVTAVDGRAIPDSDSLVAAVRSYRPGDRVTLTVVSGSKTDTVNVVLGSD